MPDKKKILVVDDSTAIRNLLSAIICDNFNNVNVDKAINGQDALKKTGLNNYNLVITDLNMPVMSGLELARKMKNIEMAKNVPVILLTDESHIEKITAALSEKIISIHIKKPFDLNEILKTIKNLLKTENT